MHGRFVFGYPFGEPFDYLITRGVVLFAVAALDGDVFGALILWDIVRRAADATQDLLPCGGHVPSPEPFLDLHHSRKVCSGIGLRSRASVQPASLPGRRWMAPLRARGHWPTLAAPWATS